MARGRTSPSSHPNTAVPSVKNGPPDGRTRSSGRLLDSRAAVQHPQATNPPESWLVIRFAWQNKKFTHDRRIIGTTVTDLVPAFGLYLVYSQNNLIFHCIPDFDNIKLFWIYRCIWVSYHFFIHPNVSEELKKNTYIHWKYLLSSPLNLFEKLQKGHLTFWKIIYHYIRETCEDLWETSRDLNFNTELLPFYLLSRPYLL